MTLQKQQYVRWSHNIIIARFIHISICHHRCCYQIFSAQYCYKVRIENFYSSVKNKCAVVVLYLMQSCDRWDIDECYARESYAYNFLDNLNKLPSNYCFTGNHSRYVRIPSEYQIPVKVVNVCSKFPRFMLSLKSHDNKIIS